MLLFSKYADGILSFPSLTFESPETHATQPKFWQLDYLNMSH